MPSLLKTPCNAPNCGRASRGGYCDEHRHLAYRRPGEDRRPTAAQRGYDHRWRKVRQRYIKQHPLCEDCLEDDVLTADHLDVDHIIPIAVRPDLRLDMNNLRTRCRTHHRLKSLEDAQRYGTT